MITIIDIQKHFISMLFKVPASEGLALIGGARLYFLNKSSRFSNDLDYHFDNDLKVKKAEIINFINNDFIPFLKRSFSINARIIPNHPEEENDNLRVIHLFFSITKKKFDLPIELTKIIYFDKKNIESFEGTIVSTLSNADIIEGKITAFFSRYYFQARDLVDIWFFKNFLIKESPKRINKKLALLNINKKDVEKKLKDLKNNKDYYIKQIKEVFKSQVLKSVTRQIEHSSGYEKIINDLTGIFKKLI